MSEKPYHMHWLHGKREFNVLIEEETQCRTCVHVIVCGRRMEVWCLNYDWGTSAGKAGCQQCMHRYTRRANRDSLPCFKCLHYKADPVYVDDREQWLIDLDKTEQEWFKEGLEQSQKIKDAHD